MGILVILQHLTNFESDAETPRGIWFLSFKCSGSAEDSRVRKDLGLTFGREMNPFVRMQAEWGRPRPTMQHSCQHCSSSNLTCRRRALDEAFAFPVPKAMYFEKSQWGGCKLATQLLLTAMQTWCRVLKAASSGAQRDEVGRDPNMDCTIATLGVSLNHSLARSLEE